MSIRAIKNLSHPKPTLEGAGVRLQRAFGFGNTRDYDPFLLFDDFRNDNPDDYLAGFPWHPHRGIETITYVLAGDVEHGDSLGNRGSLGAGDVQWMTAGSGILHQEMPKGDAQGRMHGFQLWSNLPASLKMTKPRYQDVLAKDIPEVTDDDGTKARIVVGEFWGKTGPVVGVAAEPRYVDISVPPGTEKRIADRALAPRVRLRVRGLRHVPRFVGAAVGAQRADRRARAGRGRQPLAGAVRSGRRDRGARRRRGHPVPAGVGQAARGAGGLVRPDRDEHAAGAAAGAVPVEQRHVHQRRRRRLLSAERDGHRATSTRGRCGGPDRSPSPSPCCSCSPRGGGVRAARPAGRFPAAHVAAA